MKKHFKRVFTISDWMEEENWLREQNKKGLKLCKLNPPIDFVFEECEPEDVIYKLDYKNTKASNDMKQMYLDYGWEYCGTCFGWNYFRKPASQINDEKEGELFSDNESKLSMVQKIINTRMLPLVAVFCLCLVPSLERFLQKGNLNAFDICFLSFLGVMFILYIWLFIHCGLKLKKIKKEFEK